MKSNASSHNYGIDMLRLVSFMYVIVLHTLGHGGILGTAIFGSNQYKLAMAMEIWAYCGVDIFGLISGYVSYREREEKSLSGYARAYLKLWLQVAFFSVVISLALYYLVPGSVSGNELLKGFFPVTTGAYWYFSAYTGLFALLPLLNAALRSLDTRFLRGYLLAFLLLFSLYASPMERFSLGGGYTMIWLVLLYLAGGAVRRLQMESVRRSEDIHEKTGQCPSLSTGHKWLCLAGMILCVLFSWIWLLRDWHLTVLDVEIKNNTWMNYTSFTVSLAALLHLMLFSTLHIPEGLHKFLRRIAPCGFGVYLLNTHPSLWKLTNGQFAFLGQDRLIKILAAVAVNVLVFMVGGVLLELLRQVLFGVIGRAVPLRKDDDTSGQMSRRRKQERNWHGKSS